jgi:hypothetical protein
MERNVVSYLVIINSQHEFTDHVHVTLHNSPYEMLAQTKSDSREGTGT